MFEAAMSLTVGRPHASNVGIDFGEIQVRFRRDAGMICRNGAEAGRCQAMARINNFHSGNPAVCARAGLGPQLKIMPTTEFS